MQASSVVRNLRDFARVVLAHPMGVFWLVVLLVVVWMNMRTGYEIGGDSFGLALVMGSIAVLGAYAAGKQASVTGAQRVGLLGLIVLQLCLGQFAGWQTMGLTLARGEGALASKADEATTRAERIAALRQERKALGVVEAIDAAKARRDAECVRTSRKCPFGDAARCADWLDKFGDGPQCKAAKARVAEAERAIEIDERLLPALLAEQKGGDKLKDAGAGYAVAVSIASGINRGLGGGDVTQAQVRFGFEIFVVFLLEAIATLGPWLFGMGVHGRPDVRLELVDRGDEDELDVFGLRALPAPPRRHQISVDKSGGIHRSDLIDIDPSRGGSATASSPIHIYVGERNAAATEAAAAAAQVEAEVTAAPAVVASERHELGALSADAPPIDRSRVRRDLADAEREAGDVLLAFSAACLVEAPGAQAPLTRVYERYCTWAGERALDAKAFGRLLSDATGIEIAAIGGVPHARGVVLRLGARVQAVA